MPNSVRPSQFCDAVPATNAELCTRFSKLLAIPQLLCDLFSWMLNSNGTISSEFKAEVSTYSVPTGTIMYSLTLNMGDGWLLADGSEVSRTTYAGLFAEIGTRYGDGDGSTTFTLPDLRGRSPIGAGQGSSLTNRDINAVNVGTETHTLTEDEMPSHSHTFVGPEIRTEERGDGANVTWRGSDPTEATDETGGDQPHNNIHPCLIAYPFVKI